MYVTRARTLCYMASFSAQIRALSSALRVVALRPSYTEQRPQLLRLLRSHRPLARPRRVASRKHIGAHKSSTNAAELAVHGAPGLAWLQGM